jgi:hypothetical protein
MGTLLIMLIRTLTATIHHPWLRTRMADWAFTGVAATAVTITTIITIGTIGVVGTMADFTIVVIADS